MERDRVLSGMASKQGVGWYALRGISVVALYYVWDVYWLVVLK